MPDDEDNRPEDDRGTDAPINGPSSSSDEPMPDMAQAEQILFYQDAPINGPEWFKDAVQAKSNFAQRLPGTSEWTIGNGVGSLGQLTREQLAEKQKEETDEWLADFSETMDRIHEEQRQREEWSRSIRS